MATTEVLNPARGTVDEPRKLLDGRKGLVTAYGLFLGLLTLMIVTGETGPGNLRNTEALPADYPVYQRNGGLRANEAVLGWDGWIYLWQTIGFGGGLAILGYYGWKSWQSRSLHFMVIISLAAGGMFAFDPFYNWLGYFPTDPAFLHIPHGVLPWSDLAPTFEPVFFFPLYIVWLVVPALITRAIYTRLKARGFSKHGASAFMTRHPYDAACQPGQKREGSGNWDLIRPEAVGPCAKG